MSKRKLYVGCGLTFAPQSFKDHVEQLKSTLREQWEVLEFLGTTAGAAADVYRHDIIENVGGCDALLAIADEPSFGLGWEVREAVLLGKPVVAVAHEDSRVTRMLLGATLFFPHLRFRTYKDMIRDVPGILEAELAEIAKAPTATTDR